MIDRTKEASGMMMMMMMIRDASSVFDGRRYSDKLINITHKYYGNKIFDSS